MEAPQVDLAPWMTLLRELGFTAVAGFLVYCSVKMIMWLLTRNKELSDNITKVVERNSEALERLNLTLDNRPCLITEERTEKRRRNDGEKERNAHG